MPTLPDAAVETGTWVDLDTLTVDDLRHFISAKQLAETPPDQAEQLAEWDQTLERVSDPRNTDYELDEAAQRYLELLSDTRRVAAELILEGFFYQDEVAYGVVKAAMREGLTREDAIDATAAGIAQALA